MDIFFNSNYFKNELIPVPSALNALNELKKSYDLHVVTARHDGIAEHTKAWINTHYPGIFTHLPIDYTKYIYVLLSQVYLLIYILVIILQKRLVNQ